METNGYRLLVVAGEVVTPEDLPEALARRARDGGLDVRVVSPAFTDSGFKHVFGDVDEAIAAAERRLEETLKGLKGGGVKASGKVGDADPGLAVQDELETFDADEVLVVTHPEHEGRWLEDEAFEQASDNAEVPVTRVVVERRGGGHEAHEVAHAEAHERVSEDRGRETSRSGLLPPMSPLELVGIVVGIVGTIVLFVLAANCEDVGSISGGCGVRLLLAIGAFLIALAHVVGLVLFSSVGYRGGWQRFFGIFNAVAIPLAVVVSALVG
jgi:hypothetical protein